MNTSRALVIVADDFGIGPATSRGILELASAGVLSGTVLLANSPHAESAVVAWREAGRPVEVGWHPCLTMDRPVAPAGLVRTLVDGTGRMWPLRQFLPRLLLGRIRSEEIRTELHAQYERFVALMGHAPRLVNSHQHVALFGPVGAILREVLRRQPVRPYLRRVCEPARTLWRVPGAWVKRVGLSSLGRIQARAQRREAFPGADWLAGITDPAWVKAPAFFERWLNAMPGPSVELMVHPGHFDATLVGRDCRDGDDGLQQRRVDELDLLRGASFRDACRAAGFRIATRSHFLPLGEVSHAA